MPIACAISFLIGNFIKANKMSKYDDYVGKTIRNIFVKSITRERQKNGRILPFFNCVDSFGINKKIRADFFVRGHSKGIKKSHGDTKTRLWNIWMSMRQRCRDKRCKNFYNYGGRGIKVCSKWDKNYMCFKEWSLDNGYKENLSIDRIDVNGDYCPENCRWTTMKKQQNNRTNNHLITYKNTTHTISEWADIIGMNAKSLYTGIYRGKTIEYYINKHFESLL